MDEFFVQMILLGVGAIVAIVVLTLVLSAIVNKRRGYVPTAQEPLSEYAVEVKLFDTSGAAAPQESGTFSKMQYTFTDAQTGEILGRGIQFEIVTLNIHQPTDIKVSLDSGRGFKPVIFRYTPHHNAKYIVVPDIRRGMEIFETDAF